MTFGTGATATPWVRCSPPSQCPGTQLLAVQAQRGVEGGGENGGEGGGLGWAVASAQSAGCSLALPSVLEDMICFIPDLIPNIY